MFPHYRWVWGGLAFLVGTYVLLCYLVCAGFAWTPVRILWRKFA